MQVPAFSRPALCFALLLFLGSCQCTAPAENRYAKIASTYCDCTTQLAELNKKAALAPKSELNAYFQQIQAEYSKAKECTASIVSQFGRLQAAELDSVNALLNTQCPELAGQRDLLQEMLGK